jgi:GNAT superfamily N-acetyltransferase
MATMTRNEVISAVTQAARAVVRAKGSQSSVLTLNAALQGSKREGFGPVAQAIATAIVDELDDLDVGPKVHPHPTLLRVTPKVDTEIVVNRNQSRMWEPVPGSKTAVVPRYFVSYDAAAYKPGHVGEKSALLGRVGAGGWVDGGYRMRDATGAANLEAMMAYYPSLKGAMVIGNAAVLPKMKGKGLGSALYYAMIDRIAKDGFALAPEFYGTGTPITSNDALAVWARLAQTFPSAGFVVYSPPKSNPRRSR